MLGVTGRSSVARRPRGRGVSTVVALVVALTAVAVPAAPVAAAPPFVAYHGLDGPHHQAEVDRLVPLGYRPESFSVYGDPSWPVYTATWVRRGGVAWQMRHGLTAEQYQALYDAGGPMTQG